MKKVVLKQTWVDDENHFLKGYFANELKDEEISWLKILIAKIKSFFN